MLRHRERSGIEYQDAPAARLVVGEEMLGEHCAKRSTANDDGIKGPGVRRRRAERGISGDARAPKRLGKHVAEPATLAVETEQRGWSLNVARHNSFLFLVRRVVIIPPSPYPTVGSACENTRSRRCDMQAPLHHQFIPV